MDVEATSFSQGWSLALSVVYFSLALMGIKNDVEATSFSQGWALTLSVVCFSLASMGDETASVSPLIHKYFFHSSINTHYNCSNYNTTLHLFNL
jgi:hypothetical protein